MKRLITVLSAFALILSLFAGATVSRAAQLSLTTIFKYGDEPLSGIKAAICRVADVKVVNSDTVFEATKDFASADVDFTDLTTDNNIAIAAALNAYAFSQSIERDSKSTDKDGKSVFNNLTEGLYLVAQLDEETSEYIIAPYIVAVPMFDEITKKMQYNVVAYPKSEPVKRDVEKISINVNKIWANTDIAPLSIMVQLYKNGEPHGNAVTLNAANFWSYKWDELNAADKWTVDEFNVPAGFVKTITGSASTGFIITNTKKVQSNEKITISGHKLWYHRIRDTNRYNPESKRPTSITLVVKADDVVILQKEITSADRWNWSIELDKFAEDGHEIVYTINEMRIEDYRKWIKDGVIINEYSPGDNTDIIFDDDIPLGGPDDGPDGVRIYTDEELSGPQTGDKSNLQLWYFIVGAGVLGLLIIIISANSKHIVKKFKRK